MKRIIFWAAALAVLTTGGAVRAQLGADAVLGLWYTDQNKSRVEVVRDEKTGKLFGKIVWLKEPNYEKGDAEEGKPKHDRENPDPKKQGRSIIGVEIVRGFNYDASKKQWVKGTIYDPESGKTYSCRMWFDGGRDELKVKGYVGVSILGRTTLWNRVKETESE